MSDYFLRNIPRQLLQTDCSKICQIITLFTELNFHFVNFVKEMKKWCQLKKKLLYLLRKQMFANPTTTC